MSAEWPVDVEQLKLIASDDPNDFSLVLDAFLRETRKDLDRLRSAVDAGDVQDVHRLAQSRAAASALHGMSALRPPIDGLETAAQAGDLHNAHAFLDEAESELLRIQDFLRTLDDPVSRLKAA